MVKVCSSIPVPFQAADYITPVGQRVASVRLRTDLQAEFLAGSSRIGGPALMRPRQ